MDAIEFIKKLDIITVTMYEESSYLSCTDYQKQTIMRKFLNN